jgi:hypothetical protein
MRIPRWVIRCAIWVPALLAFIIAAWEFPVIAVFVTLVCGLAGLLYLISSRRSMSPLKAEREREKHDPGAW